MKCETETKKQKSVKSGYPNDVSELNKITEDNLQQERGSNEADQHAHNRHQRTPPILICNAGPKNNRDERKNAGEKNGKYSSDEQRKGKSEHA